MQIKNLLTFFFLVNLSHDSCVITVITFFCQENSPWDNCMTLDEYNNMNTANLVDLLAQETQKFTQLMTEKEFTPEYEEIKSTIKLIQEIIEFRQDTTITQPEISFTLPDSTV